MTAPQRFDWVWYGVDENGDSHVSLGRWQKHPCQFRYKFAEIQPTEHDRQATLATEKPTSEAGVYTARGIGDLSSMVASLAQQGFRIVTVIDTQNRDYHVVAQKESEK
jgi:hypothetical protein